LLFLSSSYNAVVANITPEMGVGFQVPIKNLVSILISTAVKTTRVASLSALKGLSFRLTA
ncbi:hypothetical protein MEO39_26170, partial [Dolichospermum sp. ST_sed2]|nr:hypothetical protein [Dolichospermum sp. ST_sed2]